MNDNISTTVDMDVYRKYAIGVYLDYIVPQKEIPQNVIDVLQQIADTPPCVGAEGVFIARAILNYTEPDSIQNKKMEIKSGRNEQTIHIYPNPTGEEIYIDFSEFEKNKVVNFCLYDLLGNVILNLEIITTEGPMMVDLKNVANGCYLLILRNNEQALYKNRLIIIK